MANIVLVGMMGSGKSTIAKVLAEKFHLNLVDADGDIETQEQMTIPEIFEQKGEAYFRNREKAYLQAFDLTDVVLSTGGGMVKDEDNRQRLKEIGHVFYLRGSYETLFSRLKSQTANRPLLDLKRLSVQIHSLLEERADMYLAASHSVVDIDGKSVEAICEEISTILNE